MSEFGEPPRPSVREIGGQPVCYADQGDGDRILVLLHPIGLDWRSWLPLIQWLPAGLRVLAVDLHGFGGSGSGPPDSLAGHAADLAALAAELGLARVHVAGLSYGGTVAATFALQYPELVTSLSIVAAPTSATPELFLARADQAERDGPDGYVRPTIERWFQPETVALRPATIDYVEHCLRTTPVAHWAAGWRVLSQTDLLGRLGSIRVPTAVVAGQHDRGFPPHEMRRVAAHISCATFHEVAGTAHMVGLEAPFRLAALLYGNVLRANDCTGLGGA